MELKAKAKPNNLVIMDGSVYFRTEAGVLYALDAKTGQEKWNTKVGGRFNLSRPSLRSQSGRLCRTQQFKSSSPVRKMKLTFFMR